MKIITLDGDVVARDLSLSPVTFRGDGYYRVASGIDKTEALFSFSVQQVIVLRDIAGTGGQTKVNVYVNGTGMFNVGSEPVVPYTAGNDARVTGTPNNPAIAVGDILTMDILEVEDGFPQDVTVILKG